MPNKYFTFPLALFLSFTLTGIPAQACSWAAFANGDAAIVARTVDWHTNDNLVVKGHGRGMVMKAADTPNGLEYTTKYATLQMYHFNQRVIGEALNEMGLEGSYLFLEDSLIPEPRPGRDDVSPNNFVAYAVSCFATVQEVVDNLEKINLIPASMNLPSPEDEEPYEPERWPGHFAFADATGDKAIIKFINGKVTVHHGKEYDAMTNDPRYDVQLAIEESGYQPGGTILSLDRRMRAKLYLNDMHTRNVRTTARALLAMRGLVATVMSGTERLNPIENKVFPTVSSGLTDLRAKKYYLSRSYAWCSEIYDFSMFDPAKPEVVELKARDCPYENIDTTGVL